MGESQIIIQLPGMRERLPPRTVCQASRVCPAEPVGSCIGCGRTFCRGHQRMWRDELWGSEEPVALPYCQNCTPDPYFYRRIKAAFNSGLNSVSADPAWPWWLRDAYDAGSRCSEG